MPGTTPAGLPGRPRSSPRGQPVPVRPKPQFGMNDSDYAEEMRNDSDYAEEMRYASVPTGRERDAEMVRAAAAIPLVDDAPAHGDHAQPSAQRSMEAGQ